MSDMETVPEAEGKVAVSKDKPHGHATERLSEETSRKNHELFDAVRNMGATFDGFLEGLKDINESRQRTSSFYDPMNTPTKDAVAAENITDLMSMPPVNDAHAELQDLDAKAFTMAEAARIVHKKRTGEDATIEQLAASNEAVGEVYREWKFLLANVWNPGTATGGAEWAPTGVARQITNTYSIAGDVVRAFPRYDIPDGVKQIHYPVSIGTNGVTVSTGFTGTNPAAPADTSATAGNPLTGYMDLYPVTHRTPYFTTSIEEVEDAVPAIVQALTDEASIQLTEAWETSIFNGQTTDDASLDGANGPTAANSYARGIKNLGLRGYCIDLNSSTTDVGTGAVSADDCVTGLAAMGKFALGNLSDTVIFPSVKAYFDLLKDSDVKPVDAGWGTIRSGAMAMLYGRSVIPSDQIQNCLATGKIGASANNFTLVLLANTSRWGVGVKRTMQIKVWEAEGEDAINVRGFARHGIGWKGPASSPTDDMTHALRNITA